MKPLQTLRNPPVVAFEFPLFQKDEDEIEKFGKKLVDDMHERGYNLSYFSKAAQELVMQLFEAKKIDVWQAMFEAVFFETSFTLSETLYHVAPRVKNAEVKKHAYRFSNFLLAFGVGFDILVSILKETTMQQIDIFKKCRPAARIMLVIGQGADLNARQGHLTALAAFDVGEAAE